MHVQKTTLLIVSLSVSLLGLLGLFLLKPDISPQYIQVFGVVKSTSSKGKVTFIEFVPDDFQVVSFERMSIPEGSHRLVGRLQQYEGRVEFVVEDYD